MSCCFTCTVMNHTHSAICTFILLFYSLWAKYFKYDSNTWPFIFKTSLWQSPDHCFLLILTKKQCIQCFCNTTDFWKCHPSHIFCPLSHKDEVELGMWLTDVTRPPLWQSYIFCSRAFLWILKCLRKQMYSVLNFYIYFQDSTKMFEQL